MSILKWFTKNFVKHKGGKFSAFFISISMSEHSTLKVCEISGKQLRSNEAMPINYIKETLVEIIKKDHPIINTNGYIALKELKKIEAQKAENFLRSDNPNLSKSEKEILISIADNNPISKSPQEVENENLTFGERMADKIALFGGSWKFIIAFMAFFIIWITANIIAIKSFDPYPFILLNLILSCIAALQAPLIMMSQNRQDLKDRLRSENDYKINLKAELEIQQLNEKVDLLIIKLSEQGKI